MSGDTDAVYFVKALSDSKSMEPETDELRYSLRSLAANFTGLRNVHVLGGRPSWLSDNVWWHPGGKVLREVDKNVEDAWHSAKHLNTWNQWQAIAELARLGGLSDQFVIMNDDFFIMRELAELPNEHRGSVKDWAEARRFAGMARSGDMMDWTARWVADRYGVDPADQVAYETHAPLTVRADSFANVMEHAHRAFLGGAPRFAKRSLYGNAVRLPARLGVDHKVFDPLHQVPAGAWCLSTADAAFRYGNKAGQVGRLIRRRFSTPGPFER